MAGLPYIPEQIVVHIGRPDEPGENITMPFTDYIKNVASSEIYSTWPIESINANIYAQVSFALNRVYTEWYRSKGYPFDITSSTYVDQKFIKGRNIFNNINNIVDEIFNDYLRKEGTINPLFASYCNGTTVTCDGLSQWGTVDLAKDGKTAKEIVQYYYGNTTEIVMNAKTSENVPSYPGTPLSLGNFSENVRRMQISLNRISSNYPAIPKIPNIDGAFNKAMEDAVKEFQKIFNLKQDGVIGKSTWYKIIRIYNAVKRLAELSSEGIRLSDAPKQLLQPLRLGSIGGQVLTLQYFLSFVANFDEAIPLLEIDGNFGPQTQNAVKAFQVGHGLVANGIVNASTWQTIYDAYKGIIDFLYGKEKSERIIPYPGVVLAKGMKGSSIKNLQDELNGISKFIYEIPDLPSDGVFGVNTENVIKIFQKLFQLPVTGKVDETTWNKIGEVAISIKLGNQRLERQFPGYIIEGK